MANICCNLVGNFDITAEGIISVSSKGGTPVTVVTDGVKNVAIVAPSSGTVSISAYAGHYVHDGCPGKAGVSLNWITKTDCTVNRYLFGGYGKSFITGDVGTYAHFPTVNNIVSPVSTYEVVDASASSGPAALYTKTEQKDGYGLVYTGNPWNINTTIESTCKINLSSYGIGDYGICLLQSLNVTLTPGKVPIVNSDFIYTIDNN